MCKSGCQFQSVYSFFFFPERIFLKKSSWKVNRGEKKSTSVSLCRQMLKLKRNIILLLLMCKQSSAFFFNRSLFFLNYQHIFLERHNFFAQRIWNIRLISHPGIIMITFLLLDCYRFLEIPVGIWQSFVLIGLQIWEKFYTNHRQSNLWFCWCHGDVCKIEIFI